jgi:Glucose-6-phosphate dehydrogenase subunit N-terminal domain
VPEITVEEWAGTNVSISQVEAELATLRRASAEDGITPRQRTSVMTHIAWVPPDWLEVAERTLSGMAERHPSRTIILSPFPEDESRIDAEVSVRCFTAGESTVCGEVLELALRGDRVRAPASVVLPLLISDLPVFLRWRGEPPFGETQWGQLTGVADRLVIDSSEWDELRFLELAEVFERVDVSDIAWSRTGAWRSALAERWPAIAEQKIEIRGPRAESALLGGWLRARLERDLPPPEPAGDLGVSLDGDEVKAPREVPLSPSDLLSAELDRLGRDRIYEQAALAAVS